MLSEMFVYDEGVNLGSAFPESHVRICEQFEYRGVRESDIAEICPSNIETMNDAVVQAGTLSTEKIGQPHISQLDVGEDERINLRIVVLQWCKGKKKPSDIRTKVVVTGCPAQDLQ